MGQSITRAQTTAHGEVNSNRYQVLCGVKVAHALGIIKGDTVVEPLVHALEDDGRATVRQSAAWALGEVKGEGRNDSAHHRIEKR